MDEGHVREAPEGLYSHVVVGGARFAILYIGHSPSQGAVSIITLIDKFLDDRTDAIMRFRTALCRRGSGRDPRLSPLRRRVLRQMLQAIDGRRAGATYREIANVVLGAPPASAIIWKTMSERDAVMRRVRGGLRLIAGGYRLLLRHHRAR